jgi:iron complex transport system substrate-binding protein
MLLMIFLAALPMLAAGCRKHATPAPLSAAAMTASPTTSSSLPTVASLVPAATDLILGMNAGDRLVAVSTYDHVQPSIASLPRVGDYQTIDWEQIAVAHPSLMVVQIRSDRLPGGFTERAASLHIEPIDMTINRLADIPAALTTLGAALQLPRQADFARQQLQARLDAVQRRAAGQPRVPTLLVVGSTGTDLAGPGTFLDDLLQLAGGDNVAAPLGTPWPAVDGEMLASLKPAVIIQLIPNASPQERARTAATWARYPQLQAVASGRVYIIDDWWALLPGWHVADLAERFLMQLHRPRG